jgi:hypothetical protein
MALPYYQTVMRDKPIRYYRLSELSGTTAVDSSSSGQNATLSGTMTLGTAGLIKGDPNAAMTFDGSTGSISFPQTSLPTGAAAWTLEGWANFPSLVGLTTFPTVVGYGTRNTNEYTEVLYHPASNAWELQDWSGTVVASSVAAVAGSTYHVVGTYDGTTAAFYVNGVSAGTAAHTYNLVLTQAVIGGDTTANGWLKGIIDEVAIYNYALSADQVKNHYQVGTQGFILQQRSRMRGRVL